MRRLLVPVVVAHDFPVAAAGQDGAAEKRAFETPAFEDHGAAVTMGAGADVLEGLHVALEVEEELEAREREGVGGESPGGVGEG